MELISFVVCISVINLTLYMFVEGVVDGYRTNNSIVQLATENHYSGPYMIGLFAGNQAVKPIVSAIMG